MSWLTQAAGFVLVLAALLDVFLTVLYARSGVSLISERLGRGVWRGARAATRPLPRHARDVVLSYCGPVILVLIVTSWFALLVAGLALIAWPALGSAVTLTHGPTPTDFMTAMYFAGYCVTTLGTGELAPNTGFFRGYAVFASVVGLSMITLTLTYFVEVYTSLLRRNKFALAIRHGTGGAGDGAELLARMAGGGDFAGAKADLSDLTENLIDLSESHHFYSSMLYFRFRAPHYALPRSLQVVMEAATLLQAAPDDAKYPWLKTSYRVTQLWEAGMHLLRDLDGVYLRVGGEPNAKEHAPDAQAADEWRRRYRAAAARLRAAGIATEPDEAAAEEHYVALRRGWDGHVTALAAFLAYDPRDLRSRPTATDAAAAARGRSAPGASERAPADDDDEDQALLAQ